MKHPIQRISLAAISLAAALTSLYATTYTVSDPNTNWADAFGGAIPTAADTIYVDAPGSVYMGDGATYNADIIRFQKGGTSGITITNGSRLVLAGTNVTAYGSGSTIGKVASDNVSVVVNGGWLTFGPYLTQENGTLTFNATNSTIAGTNFLVGYRGGNATFVQDGGSFNVTNFFAGWVGSTNITVKNNAVFNVSGTMTLSAATTNGNSIMNINNSGTNLINNFYVGSGGGGDFESGNGTFTLQNGKLTGTTMAVGDSGTGFADIQAGELAYTNINVGQSRTFSSGANGRSGDGSMSLGAGVKVTTTNFRVGYNTLSTSTTKIIATSVSQGTVYINGANVSTNLFAIGTGLATKGVAKGTVEMSSGTLNVAGNMQVSANIANVETYGRFLQTGGDVTVVAGVYLAPNNATTQTTNGVIQLSGGTFTSESFFNIGSSQTADNAGTVKNAHLIVDGSKLTTLTLNVLRLGVLEFGLNSDFKSISVTGATNGLNLGTGSTITLDFTGHTMLAFEEILLVDAASIHANTTAWLAANSATIVGLDEDLYSVLLSLKDGGAGKQLIATVTAVPEASSAALVLGLAGLIAIIRRRK